MPLAVFQNIGVWEILIILVVVMLLSNDDDNAAPQTPTTTASTVPLVRANSHRLSDAPNNAPVLVEFLDFECEACGAAYPTVEALRDRYGDRVQFVARYFPLRGHVNAERAARAVEAAARQDRFEDMYRKMFETQSAWGDQQQTHDALFRSFAEQLGLDIARFDADYNDPTTLERIRLDQTDGAALGVNSTRTFFLNGQRIQLRSFNDLTRAVEAAAANTAPSRPS